MFSTLMVNTWLAGTIVAVVAGSIGFFAVLRRSAFAAHALPQGAFAGAACASLLGISTILGLFVFSILGAILIALLGRRGRHDAVTALTLVLMLSLGALFLSFSVEYAPEIYSLLFGEILGVSRSDLLPITLLGAASVLATLTLYRPLLLSSVMSDAAEARGLNTRRLELCFLLVMALAISATVPVVGTFLVFSLMIAPAGTARTLASSPLAALALSILIALATVWASIAAAYQTNWPVGFYVGTIGAAGYILARTHQAWRTRTHQQLALTHN